MSHRKKRRATEAEARQQSARHEPGETRRRVAVLLDPRPDGTVRIVLYRAGKLMVRQTLGAAEQWRLTMAWDLRQDIQIGRLFFGRNPDDSLLVGALEADGEPLTNVTLPPAAADDLLNRVVTSAGLAFGLAMAPVRGRAS